MSVHELRASCRELGIKANGGKGALAKRIAQHAVEEAATLGLHDAKHVEADTSTALVNAASVTCVLDTDKDDDITRDNVSLFGTEPFDIASRRDGFVQGDVTDDILVVERDEGEPLDAFLEDELARDPLLHADIQRTIDGVVFTGAVVTDVSTSDYTPYDTRTAMMNT